MEIRQLRYLESIVKYGTIREAAAKLFISEPAISQQINELQKEIGLSLFEKQGRKVALTSEGKQLLPLVKAVLEAITNMENVISEMVNPEVGSIKLGFVSVTTLDIVPNKLMEFAKIHPDIRVEMVESGTLELIECLLNGSVDVALISVNSRIKSVIELSDIQYNVLSNIGSVAIVPYNHPLAKQAKISLKQLLDKRIILRRQGVYREEIFSLLGDAIKQDSIYTVDTQEISLKLVELGLGITIIPEPYVITWGLNENPQVKILLLDDFQINLDICLIYKKNRYRPKYLTNFMRIFSEY